MILYEVAVAAPLRKTLTYLHPLSQVSAVPYSPGQRVLVPLGRRKVTGYILGHSDEEKKDGRELKAVIESLDPGPVFPPQLIPFFRWIADYYHHPLGEVIRTALPAGLTSGSVRRIKLTPEGRQALEAHVPDHLQDSDWYPRLLAAGELAPAAAAALCKQGRLRAMFGSWQEKGWISIAEELVRKQFQEKLQTFITVDEAYAEGVRHRCRAGRMSPAEAFDELFAELKQSERKTLAAIFDCQYESGEMSVPRPEITRRYRGAGKALHSLAERKLINLAERRLFRDLFGRQQQFFEVPDKLTPEQEQVLEELLPVLQDPVFTTFLLHGITGCGKTEVYLRAAEKVLAEGRSVLVLVPEIALTSQIEAHFYSRFGEIVAVLHSGLSQGERHDQWHHIVSGKALVVIGARSAVFAPLEKPGLIIVDEEHEPAYKQEDGLRYNGRDLAVLRARFADCPVILGSATPSVISSHNARSGKFRLLEMRRRVHDQSLPAVQIINLAENRPVRPDLCFSRELINALWENMEKRQQSLVFVNRRGFANFMMCRDCGHIMQCRHCQVSLTLHRRQQQLVCHYCGYSLTSRIVCPACNSAKMEGLGMGAERIEEEVRQIIPHARVARLDSDAVTSRKQYIDILQAVHRQEIDILVGTQMIAKGLHFPNMTLVGVVWADSGLGMPDFRASERTFQLLAQVTGRAGRGVQPGRVIIQTYRPEHYALNCARQHDYDAFFQQEIALRRELQYPPFTRMVNIRISSGDEAKVKESAEKIATLLRRFAAEKKWREFDILGPAPAPLVRIKNRTRWQILLKSAHLHSLHESCSLLLADYNKICPAGVDMAIDVDPENMM